MVLYGGEVMKVSRLGVVFAFLVAAGGSVASAQNQGQGHAPERWVCEWAAQTTTPGKPPNPVGQRFEMIVYPNGTAEGQGIDMASTGEFPFQFQAQWGMQSGQISLQGQKVGGIDGSLGRNPSPFFFTSTLVSDRQMSHRIQENGQAYASQCQLM